MVDCSRFITVMYQLMRHSDDLEHRSVLFQSLERARAYYEAVLQR